MGIHSDSVRRLDRAIRALDAGGEPPWVSWRLRGAPVVLTDGDEWQIFNSHAPVPVEEKLFRSVRATEDVAEAAKTLALLSKAQMTENAIDLQWKSHFVDRQVGKALGHLFSTVDASLVKLVRKEAPSLLPGVIKASLTRLRIALDFPAEVSIVQPAPVGGTPKLHVVKGQPAPVGGASVPKQTTPTTWAQVTMADVIAKGLDVSAGGSPFPGRDMEDGQWLGRVEGHRARRVYGAPQRPASSGEDGFLQDGRVAARWIHDR